MAYIRFAFAENGDRVTVPVTTQPDDSVSLQEGYPVQYQQDPTTVSTARRIDRNLFNSILHLISAEVQQYQQFGVPAFITAAENGGVAFPYSNGAFVRFDPGTGERVYRSLSATNTALPTDTANWLDTSTYLTAGNAVTNVVTNAGLDHTLVAGALGLSLDFSELPLVTSASTSDTVMMSIAGAGNRAITAANFLLTFITKALIDGLNVDADTLDGQQATAFIGVARVIATAAQSGLAGGGDLTVDRNLSLDIDNLATFSPLSSHELAFSTSAGATRKNTINNVVSAVVTQTFLNGFTYDANTLGGTAAASFVQTSRVIATNNGIGGGGNLGDNRTLGLTLNTLSTQNAVIGDIMVYHDTSAGIPRNMSLNSLKTVLGLQNLSGSNFTGALVASGDITAFSDERLKYIARDVVPAEALAAIRTWRKCVTGFNAHAKAIAPDTFGEKLQIGFFAQDIEDSPYPELLLPMPLGDGSDLYQTVAYDRTPVVVAAALEAAMERIELLEDAHASLHARLAAVEEVLAL